MRTKEEFDDLIKRLFAWHKIYIDTNLYDHNGATDKVLNDYSDLYSWLTEEKYKKEIDKKQAKRWALVMTGLIVLGLIITLIGWLI